MSSEYRKKIKERMDSPDLREVRLLVKETANNYLKKCDVDLKLDVSFSALYPEEEALARVNRAKKRLVIDEFLGKFVGKMIGRTGIRI